MGKTKTLTEKEIQRQKERAKLNKVLDFNEAQLVSMQKQGWKDLTDDQINVLENFIAVGIATMRICPPAYVGVASNTVAVRAKSIEAVNLSANAAGEVVREGTRHPAVKWAEKDLNKAKAEGKVKLIYSEALAEDVKS